MPYVGEIRMFGGNFAPAGWMLCEGQILPIAEYSELYQLIGTTYGGDGESTFALPDLQGRLPIHPSGELILAEKGGSESVTLTTQQVPSHIHPLQASSNNAATANAAGNVLSTTPTYSPYFVGSANTPMAPNSIGPTGGSQPHSNMQPFLCVNFIISLFGLYPTPS